MSAECKATLAHLLAFKTISEREKDQREAEIIRAHINGPSKLTGDLARQR